MAYASLLQVPLSALPHDELTENLSTAADYSVRDPVSHADSPPRHEATPFV